MIDLIAGLLNALSAEPVAADYGCMDIIDTAGNDCSSSADSASDFVFIDLGDVRWLYWVIASFNPVAGIAGDALDSYTNGLLAQEYSHHFILLYGRGIIRLIQITGGTQAIIHGFKQSEPKSVKSPIAVQLLASNQHGYF
ncbi:hypothetical protein ACT691_19700 [Vibrio metschnikovii]